MKTAGEKSVIRTRTFPHGFISKTDPFFFLNLKGVLYMRKMTAAEARGTNGGYRIYTCAMCGYKIMVGWLVWKAGLTKYKEKPDHCPNCGW